MTDFSREPSIKVGLLTDAQTVRVSLSGGFNTANGRALPDGDYTAAFGDGAVSLSGPLAIEGTSLSLFPSDPSASRLTLHDVTIGIDFHWQRKEAQALQGALHLRGGAGGITAINELPLESYLISVISSEMSASCPPPLLRAHAVVSRSWLLAQLSAAGRDGGSKQATPGGHEAGELIRWYGRENHETFDVCADDHCQRYQGISKAFSQSAFEAVAGTSGHVLMFGEEVCDARYSKSCGGMTERYAAAWEDKDVPYLAPIYDGRGEPPGFPLPLSSEENAGLWIRSSPPSYCNADSRELLARILPGFDQETTDFYRWQVTYSQQELGELLRDRVGADFGRIKALEPVARGESGRIIRLRIAGEKKTLVIGKELEIRRALSRSHLYSSAFVVEALQDGEQGYPQGFRLTGAGWGHGVGLCQIGAAVMADLGHSHEEILAHYFRGAILRKLY